MTDTNTDTPDANLINRHVIDIAKPLKTRSGKPVYNVRFGADGNIYGLILDWGTEMWFPSGIFVHNRSGQPDRNDLVYDEGSAP